MSNIAVLIPCYKRNEYTRKCLESINNAQEYTNTWIRVVNDGGGQETSKIISEYGFSYLQLPVNKGLRYVIIDFFKEVKDRNDFYKKTGYEEFKVDYIVKVDNDCVVPKNWLNDIINILETTDLDIVSPNVLPSNAAYTYGKDINSILYRPSKIVGGLWAMKASLIEDIHFENSSPGGIKGAFHLLNQIIIEKEPKVGWAHNITFQDIGHWSGTHPDHIKSESHMEYSAEVGRNVAWNI